MKANMKLKNFHCDEETIGLIKECARQQDLDTSKLIRRAVKQYLYSNLLDSDGRDNQRTQEQMIDDMMQPFPEPIFT